MKTPYPRYDVLDKWQSPSFDAPTREAITRRLHRIPERSFLTEHEWRLLEAIVAQLIPQQERIEPVPITPWIDQMLASDQREGFRHANMPPLREAWREALIAINAEARARHARDFHDLDAHARDALLHAIQDGKADPAIWKKLPPQRFFSDILLKTVAGIYYAHPAAWSEIGFGGPASPRGYVRLGFDQRDPWEAKEAG